MGCVKPARLRGASVACASRMASCGCHELDGIHREQHKNIPRRVTSKMVDFRQRVSEKRLGFIRHATTRADTVPHVVDVPSSMPAVLCGVLLQTGRRRQTEIRLQVVEHFSVRSWAGAPLELQHTAKGTETVVTCAARHTAKMDRDNTVVYKDRIAGERRFGGGRSGKMSR